MEVKVIFVCLCIFINVCHFASLGVKASSNEDTVGSALSEAAGQVENEEIADGFSGDIEQIGDFTVNMLSPKEATYAVFETLFSALPSAVRLLALLLGLVALSAVCGSVCDSLGGSASSGFGFLSAAVLTFAIIGTQMQLIFDVERMLERVGALMASMIPIVGTVWAMGGNVSTAATGTVTLGIMLGFVQGFCQVTVVPVCCVCLAAAISAGLSEGGMLEGFSSGVKKIYNFFVGLVMTVFVFSLGTQTVITGAADTVAARSAKTAASVLIPNIGGALGDTLRTVAGSVGYIKSVVGIGGILLLAVLTLPLLASLLLSRGAILISATAAEMLGCRREQKLLNEVSNVYGLMLGTVCMSVTAFSIALGLFVRCAVAAG